MKVLFISHSSGIDNLGGAELSLLHTIDQWRELKPETQFTVIARTPEGFLQSELDSRKVPHLALDFGSWVLPLVDQPPVDVVTNARMDSNAVLQMEAWMREIGPDVVITNTIVAPWAALAAKSLGIVHVWMVHEYGDLDHGLGFRIGRARTFEDIGMLSDLVVANSNAIRDHISQWIPEAKLTVAYPVIDFSRARKLAIINADANAGAATAEPQLGNALHAVLVGRLGRSKGQWRLLRAIAQLRDEGVPVTATLVGGGEPAATAEIQQLIETFELTDRVVLTGEVSNPFSLVARADVAVTASDSEAFGRVTVEYMALGKPVIATRSGANLELIRDGQTGWLFGKDNIDQLADALREAFRDPGEVRRRGEAAAAWVMDDLTAAHTLDALVGRIEQACASGSQPIDRLPNVTREWLELPRVVEGYLRDMHSIRLAAHASPTWRVGRLLMAPAKLLRRLVRRR